MAVGTRHYRGGDRRRRTAPERACRCFWRASSGRPRLQGTPIVRPALEELRNARRVTAVAAPAGFGKSTLLALWARSCRDRSVAWLSLDEHDDDSARLLAHAREAIGRAHPALRDALDEPRIAGAPTLPALVNAVERAGTPLLLLVDDCHAVRSRESRAALSYLARQLPGHDPGRVRGSRGAGAGVGTPARARRAHGDSHRRPPLHGVEADRLLQEQFGVALAPADLARLVERTEGWPAGLYLAGLSLHGHPDPPAFVREFAGDHRHVGDLLLEEVLRRETPPVRDFLLHSRCSSG